MVGHRTAPGSNPRDYAGNPRSGYISIWLTDIQGESLQTLINRLPELDEGSPPIAPQ
jgi:hypothetical protein